VASGTTRDLTPDCYTWQELDSVLVKGKAQAVAIFTPLTTEAAIAAQRTGQLQRWTAGALGLPAPGLGRGPKLARAPARRRRKKVLYQLYAQRLASMALRPQDPGWDGATRFETK
jgi:adenylate cyclase